MDRDAVLRPHLVKLVDAHHPTVGQDHGPSLQVELSGGVPDDRGGETGGRGPFARGVDGDGRDLGGELQELRLRRGGVSEQQDVDVASAPGAVGEALAGPAEEQASQSLFHVGVAKDVGRHPSEKLLRGPRRARERPELELFFRGKSRSRRGAGAVGVVDDADDAEVRHLHGRGGARAAAVLPATAVAAASARGEGRVHADGGDSRPGGDGPHEAPVDDRQQGARQVPRGDVLGPLLELDRLLVDEGGPPLQDDERVDAAAPGAVGAPRDGRPASGDGVAWLMCGGGGGGGGGGWKGKRVSFLSALRGKKKTLPLCLHRKIKIPSSYSPAALPPPPPSQYRGMCAPPSPGAIGTPRVLRQTLHWRTMRVALCFGLDEAVTIPGTMTRRETCEAARSRRVPGPKAVEEWSITWTSGGGGGAAGSPMAPRAPPAAAGSRTVLCWT